MLSWKASPGTGAARRREERAGLLGGVVRRFSFFAMRTSAVNFVLFAAMMPVGFQRHREKDLRSAHPRVSIGGEIDVRKRDGMQLLDAAASSADTIPRAACRGGLRLRDLTTAIRYIRNISNVRNRKSNTGFAMARDAPRDALKLAEQNERGRALEDRCFQDLVR